MTTITTRSGKGSPLSHTELDNNFTNLNTDKLENISEDTTPTLGGPLDGGAANISNVNVVTATSFSGSGAGLTNIPGANITGTIGNAQITSGSVVQHQGDLTITESQISDLGSYITGVAINEVSDITIDTPADNEVLAYNSGTGTWINQTAAEAGLLTTETNDLTSSVTWANVPDVNITQSSVTQHQAALTITESQISDLGSYITDVVSDTTPQLGGNLDVNAKTITSATNGNIDITPNGTGSINLTNAVLKSFNEVVYAIGTTSGTITPTISNGSIQTITLNGNMTFSAITGIAAGDSFTLIVTQDGTGSRTLTSTMKFAGGNKTLSTAGGSIDVISVFYDGTNYYASLTTGYA